MEKIDKFQSKDYGPLIIWADNLAEIVSVLQECQSIDLVADDVRYESLEEFLQESRGKAPLEVNIKASNPDLTIELHPRWAKLYISSSKIVASGLFLKIDQILSTCERKPRLIFKWNQAILLSLASNLLYLPALNSYAHLGAWALIINSCWMTFLLYIHFRKFSIVHTVCKQERPSFIKRNGDNIAIAIISAIFGAIMGVAATKLTDQLWPNGITPKVANKIAQKPEL